MGKRGRTDGAPAGETKLELERNRGVYPTSYAVIRAPDGKIKGAPIVVLELDIYMYLQERRQLS